MFFIFVVGFFVVIINDIGFFVIGFVIWIGKFVGVIIDNLLIFMFVIVGFVGFGVGLIKCFICL